MSTAQRVAALLTDVVEHAQIAQTEMRGSYDADSTYAALEALRRARTTIGDAEVVLVALMRAGGASWTTVGAALNMTKQAAHEKFGPLIA